MATAAGELIKRFTDIDPVAIRARRLKNYVRTDLIIYTALLDGRMFSCTGKIGFILGNLKIIIWPVGPQRPCSNLLDLEDFPKVIPDTRRSFFKIGRPDVETLEEEILFTELQSWHRTGISFLEMPITIAVALAATELSVFDERIGTPDMDTMSFERELRTELLVDDWTQGCPVMGIPVIHWG